MPKTNTKHNGYKNYETFNASLWILNDEILYRIYKECKSYAVFAWCMAQPPAKFNGCTPDGVRWLDPKIDHREIELAVNGWGEV